MDRVSDGDSLQSMYKDFIHVLSFLPFFLSLLFLSEFEQSNFNSIRVCLYTITDWHIIHCVFLLLRRQFRSVLFCPSVHIFLKNITLKHWLPSSRDSTERVSYVVMVMQTLRRREEGPGRRWAGRGGLGVVAGREVHLRSTVMLDQVGVIFFFSCNVLSHRWFLRVLLDELERTHLRDLGIKTRRKDNIFYSLCI